jgi:hypothetical protein
MMDLQGLITEWIKANGCSGLWMPRLWIYLTDRGASSDDALAAIEQFINAIILAKSRKPLPTLW